MELHNDLRTAARMILEKPSVLLGAVAAIAQGIVINAAVLCAAHSAPTIHRAAQYVAFLIKLS